MATGTRKTGEFCWINMITPQPAKAREFFAALLGWTYGDIPGLGYSIKVGGHEVGGMFDLEAPNTPPGTPPLIGVMVKVESADAAAAKATTLGGKSQPAFDIMDQGRMAVLFDPAGANLDVWEPRKGPGMDADSTHHGAPSWFESISTDVPRASKFYCDLFGWTSEEMPMPDFPYTTFKHNGEYVAGMMPVLPHMGKVPSHWAVYFTVKDADEAERAAVKLGGKICVPCMDIPNVGRFCGITSPQGVMFYVIKYT